MAAEIQVRFMHPIDGRILTVTLDTTYTAKEVIDELISNNFIQRDPAGYDLAIKGGTGLQQNQTLADAGVKDGDTLRIIPATDAGCCSG